MLAIRLSRIGKKNSAFFRVVVMDKQKSAKGRAIEVLGSVNPHKKDIVLKNERILYWIGVGAQPSDRVHNILVSKGVIKGPKLAKKVRKSKKEEGAEEEGRMKQEAGEEKKDEKILNQVQDDNKIEEPKAEEIKEESVKTEVGEPKEVKSVENIDTKKEEPTEESKPESKPEKEKKEIAKDKTEDKKEEAK